MYVIRSEMEVAGARAAEFEATIDELAGIHYDSPGGIGATLLRSLAYPGCYTLIARWNDRASYVAAGQREPVVAFGRRMANNVGLIRPLRMLEAYESVFEVDGPIAGQGENSTAERLVDFTITVPMVAPTFEAAIRQLAEASVQHAPGVGSVRLRRSAGVDTKYLLIVIATDAAAARGWLLAPQVRELVEQQSLNQYLASSPQGQIHHVVKRYVSSPQAIAQSVVVAAGTSP
jgi:quinol monooxygenase YgiN